MAGILRSRQTFFTGSKTGSWIYQQNSHEQTRYFELLIDALAKWTHRLRNSVTELDIAKLTSRYIHWPPLLTTMFTYLAFSTSPMHLLISTKHNLSISYDLDQMWSWQNAINFHRGTSLKFQRDFDTALCFHSRWAVDLKVEFARPRHIFTCWNILYMISALKCGNVENRFMTVCIRNQKYVGWYYQREYTLTEACLWY